MPKTRLNLSLDQDLVDFIKTFSAENRLSIADIVTQYFLSLQRGQEEESQKRLLAHPAFQQAMKDVQARLKDGTAEWHSFEEVFGD